MLTPSSTCKRKKDSLTSLEVEGLKEANYNYFKVLNQIETKWAQKARMQWIINGDHNTKKFHTKTRVRRRNYINWIIDENGIELTNPQDIMLEGVTSRIYGIQRKT